MFVMAFLLTVPLCTRIAPASDEHLRLNCSERYWYPFLYAQDDQARGILYDIVSKALENLKIKVLVKPVPFRRAMVNVREGSVDGVVAVGYQRDMMQDLDYPPDADKDLESPWRIMQVDHVVVSYAENSYEFEGALKTLPAPVRLLQDAPMIDDLCRMGIEAQEVRDDVQNFLKLMRDKNGVIITTSVTAEMMNRDSRFKGKIKIHATPVASHSYYLAFSKKSRLSSEEKMRIWKEIKRWRDDYIFMLQVFSKY